MAPKIKWAAKSSGKRKRLNKSTLKKYFNPVVIETRDRAHKHYKNITGKWQAHNQPKYRRVTGMKSLRGGGLSIYSSVGIDDPKTPLWWLEAGTSVRYRGMSRNWQSKTYPNIGIKPQRPGRGYPARWGVYPGIQPRYFRQGIIDDIEPQFRYDAQRAFDRMCKDLWK